jgi:hypothetical protein
MAERLHLASLAQSEANATALLAENQVLRARLEQSDAAVTALRARLAKRGRQQPHAAAAQLAAGGSINLAPPGGSAAHSEPDYEACRRAGRPLLYVYDLPKKYQDAGKPQGQDYPNLMERDGQPLPGLPPRLRLYNTGSLVLGGIMYKRAQEKQGR